MRKGTKHSEEVRNKMSKIHKERPNRYWLGKKRYPETIEKIRKANKGKKLSEETRRKLSESHKGETHDFFLRSAWPNRPTFMGEALRSRTPRKIGEGCHTFALKYYSIIPRISSSRAIKYSLPSTFTSVGPYLVNRTRSPFLTFIGILFPSSVSLPDPTATTFPSCGRSLSAVSGR